MLSDILEQKKCFKLVCGAGNEDASEVEKLVAIYSKAGCTFFDVCAKSEIVDAAKLGLARAGISQDRYLCVSIGIAGDPHTNKANINVNKCNSCTLCTKNCPHDAIIKNKIIEINQARCIGCSQCINICPNNAISVESKIVDYNDVLPLLISKGIDCIEFHAISEDENDIWEKWNLINRLYDGMLCISVDRSILGDKKLKELITKLLSIRKPYTTIIQADGVAMRGNDDTKGTTLQAIATAQLFQNAKLPAYIMMSGGTNSESTKLAKECGVFPNCLAVGSYARKIVKEFIYREDLFTNADIFNEAVKRAKTLVDESLKYMG